MTPRSKELLAEYADTINNLITFCVYFPEDRNSADSMLRACSKLACIIRDELTPLTSSHLPPDKRGQINVE